MDAFVVDAVRSPIGRRNGALSVIRGDDLAAQVLNGLIARHDLDPLEIEDVQMGCVTQIGEQGWNVGRMAVLAAGWPVEVSATTVDRQCGSSMQTNFNAAAAIMAGQLDLVVSAGVEMMSRVPMGSNGGSVSDQVTGRHEIVMQGTSAELLADEWHLTREELDAYSLESHRRALAASDGGTFEREIIPIELPGDDPGEDPVPGTSTTLLQALGAPSSARQEPVPGTSNSLLQAAAAMFSVDEAPRRETSAEALAALEPAFRPGGVVTAGNASQIVDGSAAVLLASEAAVTRLGLEPRARFVSFGIAGVDPTRMLHGNPQAMEKALAKAGLTLDEMGVIEVNEAFACVVLQTARDLHLEERMGDVNPNGGGISLGHPLGATGARITATLVSELERRDARYGIASMCVGFGMAIAGVVERL
ncbi:MAG TPA: thiolase family protein [Gaiellaceae bacterium]|nr:thiolase family protein [Gaiellaceae bacterium]